MLLWAFNPANPYGYYTLLRLACFGVFAYLALQTFAEKKRGWTWVLAITAAIYNPVFRVHLTRDIWSVVNVVTILIALASIAIVMRKGNS